MDKEELKQAADKYVEIPFGAKDSELCGFEYTIPEGMEAKIKDGKVIIRQKESEDEKIRKNLIRMVGNVRNDSTEKGYYDIPFDKYVAYLEKQKDEAQRQFNLGVQAGRKEALYEIEKQKEQKPSSYSHLEITNVVRRALQECEGFRNYRADVYAARVGATVETLLQEQKPAEWSEEDEDNLSAVKSAVYDYFDEGYAEELYSWLKLLPERFNLQPKQEWSEEEKGILLECISVLQNNSCWVLADKLSSLRPQPKREQMALRWESGHPESYKSVLILRKGNVVVEGEWDEKTGRWYQYGFQSYIKDNEVEGWMNKKSLLSDTSDFRPSWKPSEEQMRVFLKANPVNLMPEELSIYNSLCNDIQKLM